MGPTTGILFLPLNSFVNTSLISKVVSAAAQKVKKTLYIQLKDLPSERKVSMYNRVVNNIYKISSKDSSDCFDTRVILTDLRDSLVNSKSTSKIHTSHMIDTLVFVGKQEKLLLECIENKQKDVNEVLVQIPSVNNDTASETELHEVKLTEDIPHLAPEEKIYDHVVLGGTFDRLHAGHKMLLSAAVLRCRKSLTIGVTDGVMIQTKKLWELIEPCQERIDKLKEFLIDIEPRLQYNVVPITDPYGPTAHLSNLELLVVSEETLKGGFKVNELRKGKGLPLLDIHIINLIEDTRASHEEESKISSSSLRKRLLGTHLRMPTVKSKPYIIGLTGGIASGKTSISHRLTTLGARIISCDHLGHAAYKKGTKCYQQIVDYFGVSILNEENEIDRKRLGPVVFSNKEHLVKLNSIVWPEIRHLYMEEISALKKENFEGVIVLDAAVLLEAGWDKDCAEVWVSFVPKDEAIKRIVQRDRIGMEQASLRVESQMKNSDRIAKANVVFCSVWEPEVTGSQVLKAWQFVQSYIAE